MATAPDPKALRLELAEKEALEEAAKVKAAREKLVAWVLLDGERRTFRYLDFRGVDAAPLRAHGLRHNEIWQGILNGPDLDHLLAAWWLAGRHAGVTGEDLGELLGRSFDAAPGYRFAPDEDEDEAEDDDSPPV